MVVDVVSPGGRVGLRAGFGGAPAETDVFLAAPLVGSCADANSVRVRSAKTEHWSLCFCINPHVVYMNRLELKKRMR